MNYKDHIDLFGTKVKLIPNITGNGAPSSATEGAVGCMYMDTITGALYKCIAAMDGVYTWVPVGEGGGGGGGDCEINAAIVAFLGNGKQNVTIRKGYVNVNDGSYPGSPSSSSYNKRACTSTLIPVNGNTIIVIPDGYCARVFYYTPDYERYEDWKNGILHIYGNDIAIRVTFAKNDTTADITDDEISYLQESFIVGNCDADKQQIMAEIEAISNGMRYADSAPDFAFEVGTISSSTGANSSAPGTRVRTKDYIVATAATCYIDDGYQYAIYCYDVDNTFIKKTVWQSEPFYIDPATVEGCKYLRVVIGRKDEAAFTDVAEAQNAFHMVLGTVDATLTKPGVPADAHAVGQMISNLGNGGNTEKRTVKILGIGNSYTRDSFRWLWKILKESGFGDVVVAHGYWGGSTLAEQFESLDAASENHTRYVYWKYTTNQKATLTNSVSLDSILTDEPWDIVVFQQQSDWAGQYEGFVSDAFDINDFIDYVKTAIGNDKLKIGIASTWSHAAGYSSDKFQTLYNSDPETQYQAINSTIPQVANHMSQCDYVVHTGKAVELGRANQFLGALGDEMLRPDKNHLAFGIPSFMAGMVYAITLCGIKPCDVAWYPTTADDAEIVTDTSAYLAYLAKQCAAAASQVI